MDPLLALAIVERLVVLGAKALPAIMAAFENGDPTPEDIRALKIDKDPEDYF